MKISDRPEILAAGFLPDDAMAGLEARFTVHHYYRDPDPQALLDRVKHQVVWMVGTSHASMPASLINALPNLAGVSVYGTGFEKVDVPALSARQLILTNTPDVMIEDVADLGIGLILATVRRMCAADRFTREGRCANGVMPFAHSLQGKTLGIVGMGRIGKAMAQRASAFNLNLIWYGPRPKPELPYPRYDSLEALARASDILLLAMPGSPETRHMVNAEILDCLGPDGTLINLARGMVVDEAALVAALKTGRLGAAGLDVFEDLAHPSPELFDMDNVVLSPHRGSATFESRHAMAQLFLANVHAFFEGKPPRSLVDI